LNRIHTIYAISAKGLQWYLRYSTEIPKFSQNYLAMGNTLNVAGGKPIAVWLQSISGVHAINLLVVVYGNLRRKEWYYYIVVSRILYETQCMKKLLSCCRSPPAAMVGRPSAPGLSVAIIKLIFYNFNLRDSFDFFRCFVFLSLYR
jgi:hypothetical protein